MTEGRNGEQLTPREEVNGIYEYEGPCPICELFHYDFCTMEDVLKELIE